jgi:oleandomycin transport system permease protein
MGDVARYVISIVVTLGFAMILGFRVTTNPFAAIAGCLLVLAFAMAMCWISALIGLIVKSPQSVQALSFTAMFPIVFASGLLVPIQTMPGWLQVFAKANPMTLLADACRGLMTGGPVTVAAGESMLWALGILIVFAPLAVRVYRRKT